MGPIRRRAASAALSATFLAGLTLPAAAPAQSGDPALSAEIRRTEHGVPHIVAPDWRSLGFGYGYVIAQDNLCVLADSYATSGAQRSRHFGPGASYTVGGNGATFNNLDSDFFYQRIIDRETVEGILAKAPPHGPAPEIKEGVRGYVAGYNKYLADGGPAADQHECADAAWVRPISEIDVYRRFYQLGLLASSGVAITGIAQAAPPHPGVLPEPGGAAASSKRVAMLRELAQRFPLGGIGSNAVGLGSEATANGRGMLLGNPHFPWHGSERFYQAQLEIPGELKSSGGSLMGVPLTLIGHTEKLAWSHTVSTAFRFTPFAVKLVPGSPTTYLYDGQPRKMRRETVRVTVAPGDVRERTLYSTHHGPILTSILGLPLFPWTPAMAYAMGDANAANFRYLNHFLETNQAQSTTELHEILVRNQGIPWVNTIAADDAGRAFYADISVTPAVSDARRDACITEPLGVAAPALLGLPVLDGSRSACEWEVDADAVQPGTFGPSRMPHLFRDDYVSNMNDSYWLTNPRRPIEGYARIIGQERSARSLRTRSGLVMIEEKLAEGGKFSGVGDLQEMLFSNRQHFAELVREDLVALCKQAPLMIGSSGPVDVSGACPVLEAWDGRDDVDSRGAALFRRFATRALAAPATGVSSSHVVFLVPFDVNDPYRTPRDLNPFSPQVRQALADAVTDLRNANIALDARLGDVQYELRGDERIPIHGGPGGLGVFNAISAPWSSSKGYPDIVHGTSFVQTVQFRGDGCPDSQALLSYSQSTNPKSPYYADQTRKYSAEQWIPMQFCDDELKATTEPVVIGSAGG